MSMRHRLSRWLTKRFTLKNPPQWFVSWIGGEPSASGVTVGKDTALQYTPFWAAVRIISGTLGALPFKVYRRLDNGGKEVVADHTVYRLLHERPNQYVDAVTFLETRMAHVLCYGNGYAEIQRDGRGRAVALWPLLPTRVTRKVRADGTLYYEVRIGDAGEKVELADDQVLHVKGLGFDGYTGYDVVSYHKDAIGYGIAAKEYGARFFANDANPGGVLEHPATLSERAYSHLKESWNAGHAGVSNAHRMQILEEGMKWNKVGVEPDKAQLIEAMKFTIDDCARIFQIPPHKLGSMEFSKYNNVEQLQIDFVTTTMLYWFRKWEQEVNYKLLMPSEQGRLFCEILVDGLLRGNVDARTQYYTAGRQWGFLSINDIRAKENMNPIGPEGDVYLDPMNMAPAGTLKAPAAEPDEPPAEPDDDDEPVRAAHRELLAAQLRRIITKQNHANGQKAADGWWENHHKWARALLREPANAYASLFGLNGLRAAEIVEPWILRRFDPQQPLADADAERLADELMDAIGGDHA